MEGILLASAAVERAPSEGSILVVLEDLVLLVDDLPVELGVNFVVKDGVVVLDFVLVQVHHLDVAVVLRRENKILETLLTHMTLVPALRGFNLVPLLLQVLKLHLQLLHFCCSNIPLVFYFYF